MRLNLVTGPLFFAGVFQGMNKRRESSFQPDPRAHYKLAGLTTVFTTMSSLNEYFKQHHPALKSSFASHLVGGGFGAGILLSGSAYCMGLLLTKVPSKPFLE